MDFIKESVLTKLANYGYHLREEGLVPEAGEPSQDLQDFCKTAVRYASQYTPPRKETKSCETVKEGNTVYALVTGMEYYYGCRSVYYEYKIDQTGPTNRGFYWHDYQSCTWSSRYNWYGPEKGWKQEESINIGEQSYQVRGIEYTSEGCYWPGLVRPKHPTSYDDRVELKYPYSRRRVTELGGNQYDFDRLWNLMLDWGSEKALDVLRQEAARRDADPKWQLTARLNRRLIQKGRIEEAQRLVKRYLFPYRERD